MAQPTDILNQVRTVWGNLTSAQKAAAIGVTVLVFGGILAGSFWGGRPDYRQLVGNLSSKDLAPLIARLESDGIDDYRVTADGSAILVDVDDYEMARTSLYRNGLVPAAAEDDDSKGLFGGGSINSREMTFAHARKIEKRLAAMLGEFDFIDHAKVTITPSVDKYFKKGRKPAKASVVVKPRGALSDHQIQSIAHVVAAGVENLSADQVAISDTRGIVLHHPSEPGRAADLTPQIEHQLAIERRRSLQAQETLDRVYGPSKAFVNVSVEIDWTRSQKHEKTFDPEARVTTQKSKTESKKMRPARVPGGPVGNNAVNNGTAAAAATGTGSETNLTVTETSQFNSTESESVMVGGEIKRMTVGIFLDESLAEKSAEIMETIKAVVGFDESRKDVIAVTTAEIAAPDVESIEDEMAAAETRETILAYSEYGLYGLVGLLFVFFTLRTVKRAQASLRTVLETSLEEEEEVVPERPLTLEEEVMKVTSENTVLAGRSLRRWLYEGVSD